MTEPKTPEDWQHAAERWEAAHGEMMAAAGRWETAAEEWRRAFLTASNSSSRLGAELVTARAQTQQAWDETERLRYDLEREKIDIELVGKDLHRALDIVEDQRREMERIKADLQRAWDQAEHEHQRALHNDRVATFASRQRDHMAILMTPEQHATLGRMMAEDEVR